MSKFGTAITFLMGAALGGAAVWYVTKDQYARLAEEEINSVKEAYAQREQKKNEQKAASYTAKIINKGDISDYARKIQNGEPIKYSQTVAAKLDEAALPKALQKPPYVIAPEDFGDLDEYTAVSLFYYADGVLADEYGVIVGDVEEIVGDALYHFGEYEDDAVYVRNEAKRCEYEILREDREYAEFRKTLPPNV